MDALLTCVTVVALAEIGDKTQLLALVLAARFRAPFTVISGIALATVVNHALAAWAGVLVTGLVPEQVLRWLLGLSFIVMALWTLKPDRIDDDACEPERRFGPLITTTVTFFLVEMGDKTQVATVALAASFDAVLVVAIGTTVGIAGGERAGRAARGARRCQAADGAHPWRGGCLLPASGVAGDAGRGFRLRSWMRCRGMARICAIAARRCPLPGLPPSRARVARSVTNLRPAVLQAISPVPELHARRSRGRCAGYWTALPARHCHSR